MYINLIVQVLMKSLIPISRYWLNRMKFCHMYNYVINCCGNVPNMTNRIAPIPKKNLSMARFFDGNSFNARPKIIPNVMIKYPPYTASATADPTLSHVTLFKRDHSLDSFCK